MAIQMKTTFKTPPPPFYLQVRLKKNSFFWVISELVLVDLKKSP